MIVFGGGREPRVTPDNILAIPFKRIFQIIQGNFLPSPPRARAFGTGVTTWNILFCRTEMAAAAGGAELRVPPSRWFRSNQTSLCCCGTRLKPVKRKTGEIRTALPRLDRTLLRDLFAADGRVISAAHGETPDERYEKNVDLMDRRVRLALSVEPKPSVGESFISGA